MSSHNTIQKIKPAFYNVTSVKVAAVLCVFGFIAYANSLSYPFVHDDVVFIQKNPHIADLSDIPSFFLKDASFSRQLPIVNIYWRPLLELIYRLQYRMFGLNPLGYHFCNIVFHILSSFLVYTIVDLLFKRRKLAFGVAVLFLVHPVQSEAVSSITGISNLAFSLLCMAGFILYVSSAKRNGGYRNIILYGCSLITFYAALFAKEQAAVLPFLIVLYEYRFASESEMRPNTKYMRIGGIFLVLFGYMAFRRIVLLQAIPQILSYPQELWLRILAIPRTLLMYLGLIVFPVNLHFYRSIDILGSTVVPALFLGLLVIMTVVVIRRAPRDNRNILIFGLSWFIITLFPVLNIVPVIAEYSFIWTPEHFLYLPIIGLLTFILVTTWRYFELLFKKKGGYVAFGALLLVIAILISMTRKQNTYWRGEIPLFRRAAAFEKNLGRVRRLLAQAYYFNNEFDKAISEYTVALRVMEQYVGKAASTESKNFYLGFVKGLHFDLAHCYEGKKDFESAIAEYKKAIDLDPSDSVLHNNVGTNYLRLGALDVALEYFRQAVSLNPKNAMAINNMAICYIDRGEPKEAKRLLRQAVKIDRYFIPAQENLRRLLQKP